MKAHVEHDWPSRLVKVWIYSDGFDGAHVLGIDGTVAYVVPDREAFATPTFALRLDAFEAVMREAEGVVPAGSATTEALRDARHVRDRLLALVEKLTNP